MSLDNVADYSLQMTNSLNIAAMYTLQMMRFYLWLKTVELQSGFAAKVAFHFIPTIYHYKNITIIRLKSALFTFNYLFGLKGCFFSIIKKDLPLM